MHRLAQYMSRGMPRIDGWLNQRTAELIVGLSAIQGRMGVSGAVGEIGVHHGKLFILLQLCTTPGERSFAVDVFEHQDLNIDGSGCGDLSIFQSNVQTWAAPDEPPIIFAKSSFDVSSAELLDACGRARLVSIDGGHTADCVYNDLELIEAVMTKGGIVLLDDYFHQDWPDVSTGASRYMHKSKGLCPFAIAPNKVFLTTPDSVAIYQQKIIAEIKFRPDKTSRMFGCDVSIFHEPPSAQLVYSSLKAYVRETPIGPYLLRLQRMLGR